MGSFMAAGVCRYLLAGELWVIESSRTLLIPRSLLGVDTVCGAYWEVSGWVWGTDEQIMKCFLVAEEALCVANIFMTDLHTYSDCP